MHLVIGRSEFPLFLCLLVKPRNISASEAHGSNACRASALFGNIIWTENVAQYPFARCGQRIARENIIRAVRLQLEDPKLGDFQRLPDYP